MKKKFVVLRTATPLRPIAGTESLDAFRGDVATSVDVVHLEPNEAVQLRREAGVLAITPAMPIKLIKPTKAKSATNSPDAWGLAAVGAARTSFQGRGVTVAVLDTGIDAAHAAFQGVALDQHDFSGAGDGDRNGHGTHCAATIFGKDVNGVRIGVAREIDRALIGKVLDDDGNGESEMMFEGLKWAVARGANVISMSVGFDFPGMVASLVDENWPVDLATSTALEAYRGNLMMFNAIMRMVQAGAPFNTDPIVIAAAGNESRRSVNPDYRIAASVPAVSDGVIAVGALGQTSGQLSVADFSNSQPEVVAPGVDVLSAQAGADLCTMSGTSMACPHVAGVAALWWEALKSGGSRAGGATVQAKVLASAACTNILNPDELDVGLGLVSCP